MRRVGELVTFVEPLSVCCDKIIKLEECKMKDYEIINQEFNKLESDVSYYFFPNLLYNTCIETNLTSLCYVPSFRKQNNHEKLDYELCLQTTLKRIPLTYIM